MKFRWPFQHTRAFNSELLLWTRSSFRACHIQCGQKKTTSLAWIIAEGKGIDMEEFPNVTFQKLENAEQWRRVNMVFYSFFLYYARLQIRSQRLYCSFTFVVSLTQLIYFQRQTNRRGKAGRSTRMKYSVCYPTLSNGGERGRKIRRERGAHDQSWLLSPQTITCSTASTNLGYRCLCRYCP